MSAIGKGDWVQCVHVAEHRGRLRKGGVYCVESIHDDVTSPCGYCEGTIGIEVFGVCHPDFYCCPCQFTPLGGHGQTVERRELADA